MAGACSGDEDMQRLDSDATIPSVEAVQARFGSLPLEQRLSGEAEIDVENIRDLLLSGMFVAVDILYGESEQVKLYLYLS